MKALAIKQADLLQRYTKYNSEMYSGASLQRVRKEITKISGFFFFQS